MRKMSIVSLTILFLLSGCTLHLGNYLGKPPVPVGTIADQQFAAYPMLEENPYLVLNDFERAEQLQDFPLPNTDNASRIFFSTSPAATGTGALGLSFGAKHDHGLVFTTLIRQWKAYNLFLCAIYTNEAQQDCEIGITDAAGKSYRHRDLLTKGWNKVQVDLDAARAVIDLGCVNKVDFSFPGSGPGPFYLDDLILVDYHKTFLGVADGPPGTLYAVQDGKRMSHSVPTAGLNWISARADG